MQKKIDTYFAFALIALIAVGVLLWHSIAIFNLEQDLKNLQTIASSLRGGTTTQSQEEIIQNLQNVMPTEVAELQDTQISPQGRDDTGTDTEILYNEDGSIDTSNWLTYTNEEYGFSVQYPSQVEVCPTLMPDSTGDGSCWMVNTILVTSDDNCPYENRSLRCIYEEGIFGIGSGHPQHPFDIGIISILSKDTKDYYKTDYPQFQNHEIKYDLFEYVTNADLSAKFVITKSSKDGFNSTSVLTSNVYIEKGDLIYRIQLEFVDSIESFRGIPEAFVNTFTFVK